MESQPNPSQEAHLPQPPVLSEAAEVAQKIVLDFQQDTHVASATQWVAERLAEMPEVSDDDHAWWDGAAADATQITAGVQRRKADAETKRKLIGAPYRQVVITVNDTFKVITDKLDQISQATSKIATANARRLQRVNQAKAEVERAVAARAAAEAAERQAEAEKKAREANSIERQQEAQQEATEAYQERVEAISEVRQIKEEKPEAVAVETDDGKVIKTHIKTKIVSVEITDWKALFNYLLSDQKNNNVFKLPSILKLDQVVAKRLISAGGDIPGLFAETEEVAETRTTKTTKGTK